MGLYDHWASLGNEGWSYDEILKYFKKAEHNETFDDEFHGQEGPLNVSKIRYRNKPTKDFVEALDQRFTNTMKTLMAQNKRVLVFIKLHKKMVKMQQLLKRI